MIRFIEAKKSFGKKQVLRGITFDIEPGQIVFVIGKSGTGKSVLLKHLVGLMKPDSGEIWIEDQRIDQLSEEALLGVRKTCGMNFQFPALLDSLTVRQNMEFGLNAHRIATDPKEREQLILEQLDKVQIGEEQLERFPTELSFGIQKRVAIARALVLNPKYVLFDEPTTSLDPVTANGINQLIADLTRKFGVTSLVVSHDMHCALAIADRILLFDQGKVVEDGSPKSLLDSEVELAQEFMREVKERERLQYGEDK